jgi:hypothetical protein
LLGALAQIGDMAARLYIAKSIAPFAAYMSLTIATSPSAGLVEYVWVKSDFIALAATFGVALVAHVARKVIAARRPVAIHA